MKLIQLYFNAEHLPTKTNPQKSLHLTLPQIYKWGITAPVNIGFGTAETPQYGATEYKIVILGFGFIYNSNWDN